MNGEDRPKAASTRAKMHRRARSGPIAGSDRVIAALRRLGGLATRDELLDALVPEIGARAASSAIEIALLGRRIVLASRGGVLIAVLAEGEG